MYSLETEYNTKLYAIIALPYFSQISSVFFFTFMEIFDEMMKYSMFLLLKLAPLDSYTCI